MEFFYLCILEESEAEITLETKHFTNWFLSFTCG